MKLEIDLYILFKKLLMKINFNNEMKKLAILGASYLQKPLIEKAKEMGIETHCFAWDNDLAVCKNISDFFYPISVLEKEQLLVKCKEIGIDGITTIATDICVPTIAFIAENLNLISNSYKSSIIATNKAKMRLAFEDANVNSPKSICLENTKLINELNLSFPLIVKPTDRSGSRGVSKVYNEIELKNAIDRGLEESLENKVVIEEFIEGVEVSVESISWQGNHHILVITDKVTTGEPYFVELAHHQPSALSNEIQEKIKSETLKALNALEVKFGASHSEFKITNEGKVYAIEVGARMGGDFIGSDLVYLSTGYDFVKGVIDVSLGQFSLPIIKNNKYSGVYFLSKNSEKLAPIFNQTNQFEVKKEIFNTNLLEINNSNDRSGYLIYQSNKKIIL
jgi:biotin carboxylase